MAMKRAAAPMLSAARRALIGSGVVRVNGVAAAASQALQPATANARLRSVTPVPCSSRRRWYSQPASGTQNIWTFEDVQKLTQESKPGVVIVDVREPEELKSTGHIPHAINIPITSSPESFNITEDEFEYKFGFPRPSKDAEIVFYCKAGVRSRAAAGLARAAGWANVGEYPGSWMDWAAKGGKIDKK